MKQTIVRKDGFDAAHRIKNHTGACNFIHGHRYNYELEFEFDASKGSLDSALGYSIDFSEIKRIAVQFLLDYFDHGFIVNPADEEIIELLIKLKSKMWPMSLNGKGVFCNPSVENMAKEIFMAISSIMNSNDLTFSKLILYETPNSFTTCTTESISDREYLSFMSANQNMLADYKNKKGRISYDSTK
jgi:6-pyruvoyltetrahydropterin/6-carboxytetrahydropterin synthase